ncbi:uncharacterized protein LOC125756178 [Rhipicephalus sanguineus]|uniref:uncharacterized protein LOC125756178 n=1 Tax=Rhipicephalus sanguineus TaxID=34632 RepID=UPI001893B75E|nr:uncharacterized protein LOC125756178 [Rhipicephalus sanguineus]
MNLQGTKKKGCAATMTLKWIELYPDFQVDVPQPCGQTKEGRLKADKAKQLQEALDAKQTVTKETRLYIRIADCSSHRNHGFEDMEAFSQNMDRNIAERIQMLAREGITCVSDVKKCLYYYVHDVLFANKKKPDSSCRAFFPTHRDISNQIQAVLRKDRFSTVDQENASILIEKIRGEQPESSIVYRPYASRSFVGSNDSNNVEESVASECEDTLLFCFQTKFMRNMLKKYGGSVVCLDATHKTSDYALPLFLLVVKTPSGYTPAGVFIIQFETAQCIAEALSVFKQWCDNWSPQYWMVDYSKAEISAIKQVFPESQISICDFHRLQAWQRWLRRKENDVSNPDEALRLMKRLASASNQDEFDKAFEVLVTSEHWKNDKFRSYFEAVWLSVKELWVLYYRLEFDVVLTTNNGIEAQNRVLKAQYVKSASGKRSLTSLITAVVHGYLPDKEVKFHEAAKRQSSVYRQYSENVPAYLHNRPHGFVKHMLRRLVNAEEYTHTDMKELSTEGMFSVHSERSDDDVYTVDFTKPSCTCPDFRKHKYPCKHFCVVFKYSDRWGFSSLPHSYLSRPQITLGSCPESETGFEIPLVNEPSPSEMSSQPFGTAVSEPDIPFVNEPSICEVPSQPAIALVPRTVTPSLSELRKSITEEWEKCSSLLYCCHDVQTLSEARGLLQATFRKLAESVPQSSGLHIRGSPTKGCSSLKPLPKRRRL